jgi:hypothetical protein
LLTLDQLWSLDQKRRRTTRNSGDSHLLFSACSRRFLGAALGGRESLLPANP